MSPIYGYDFWYVKLRPYVDYSTYTSYTKCKVEGREKLPENGALIIAPNHCNALMDALVVLRANKGPTVFGARADAFTPLFSKILTFLKILPMVRKRDGLRNVLKNFDTIDKIVEVLENDVPFCMFSEGTHRTKHSLLPLSKGILRVAMAANDKFGDKKPVYIVPTGLEYGDYYRYRSTSLLTYGEPINVTEMLKALDGESEAHIYQTIKDVLAERMSSLITCIRDERNYDAIWTLIKASTVHTDDLSELLERNRRTAEKLEAYASEHAEAASELFSKAEKFEKERKKAGISCKSLNRTHVPMRIAAKILGTVIGLPYFIVAGILTFPMWIAAETVKPKLKDPAFRNTLRFAVKAALTPVMFILLGVTFFLTLPWQYAVAGLLLFIPAYGYVYDYAHFMRILASDIRLAFNGEIRKMHSELMTDLAGIGHQGTEHKPETSGHHTDNI